MLLGKISPHYISIFTASKTTVFFLSRWAKKEATQLRLCSEPVREPHSYQLLIFVQPTVPDTTNQSSSPRNKNSKKICPSFTIPFISLHCVISEKQETLMLYSTLSTESITNREITVSSNQTYISQRSG